MDHYAIESAVDRSLDLYYDEPKLFKQLAKQGMQYDYSWKNSGDEYVKVYNYIRCRPST
jgi:starch synthase